RALRGFAFAAAAGLVSTTAAQTPPSRFRAGVDLVQVDVSVLDKDRRPVRGLVASDFTVTEDGQPRPVAAFGEIDLPPRVATPLAPWTRDVGSDVATNAMPEEG